MAEKKAADRPTKGTSRANKEKRPERARISGLRSNLEVRGKDENFHYHWAAAYDADDSRILHLKDRGYTHVTKEEVQGIGDAHVFTTENLGSIVRKPAGSSKGSKDNRWLYLMKIPNDWHNEDLEDAESVVRATEESMEEGVPMGVGAEDHDGFYSKNIKINS